jgi:Competence protein CoiA-like family
MHNHLLQGALDSPENGRLVSIYDVRVGNKDKSYCTTCKLPLIAKNKNKSPNQILEKGQKVAHFAHENGSDCRNASESALHLLAKELLCKYKSLLTPRYIYNNKVIIDKKFIVFDEAILEKNIQVNDTFIRPDAILMKNGKELFIEFYKTHSVDYEKTEKIKKLKVSCIEINLNELNLLNKNGKINEDGVYDLLTMNIDSKWWIYNNKAEYQIKKILESSIENMSDDENDIDDDVYVDYSRTIEDEEKLNKWKKKLRDDGYKFRKIYNGGFGTYEFVYCPKLKHFQEDYRVYVDFSCAKCSHYKNHVKNYKGYWCVACSYKK